MAFKMHTDEELKKLNQKDLVKEARITEDELIKRKIHVRLGEEKQSHLIKKTRRYLARNKTIQTQLKHAK